MLYADFSKGINKGFLQGVPSPKHRILHVSHEIQIEAEKRYAVEEAREEALAEGEAKGAAAKQLEIAREMLKENLPIETISRITGLTEEQVNNL